MNINVMKIRIYTRTGGHNTHTATLGLVVVLVLALERLPLMCRVCDSVSTQIQKANANANTKGEHTTPPSQPQPIYTRCVVRVCISDSLFATMRVALASADYVRAECAWSGYAESRHFMRMVLVGMSIETTMRALSAIVAAADSAECWTW